MADAGESSPGFVGGFTTYVRTRKGMVLATEAILCIVVLICYGASVYAGYVTIPVVELVFAIVFFVIFMLHLDRTISFIHWPITDLIRALIGALCFIITSIITVIRSDTPGVVGGVFGLLAGILFAYDSYLIIMSLKRSHAPAATDSPDGV